MPKPKVLSPELWLDNLPPAERQQAVTEEIRILLALHGIPQKNREYDPPHALTYVAPKTSPEFLQRLARESGKVTAEQILYRYQCLVDGLIEISTDRATSLMLKGEFREYFFGYSGFFPYAEKFIQAIAGISDGHSLKNELVCNLFRPFGDDELSPTLTKKLMAYIQTKPKELRTRLDTRTSLIEQAILLFTVENSVPLDFTLNQWRKKWSSNSSAGVFMRNTGEITNYADYPEKQRYDLISRLATKGGIVGLCFLPIWPLELQAVFATVVIPTATILAFRDAEKHKEKQDFLKHHFAAIDVHEIIHRESSDTNHSEKKGKVGYKTFYYR